MLASCRVVFVALTSPSRLEPDFAAPFSPKRARETPPSDLILVHKLKHFMNATGRGKCAQNVDDDAEIEVGRVSGESLHERGAKGLQ